MARRQPLAALCAALLLIAPATADARSLSKREARAEGYRFTSNFVDLLDVERKVGTNMEPARECRRIARLTIRCQFTATLYTGKTIHSHVTVHRQKDGLLGFRLPLDVLKESV